MSNEMVSQTENLPNMSDEEYAIAEWNAAAEGADKVIGHSLIGGKENEQTLDLLVGVPFVIEGVTFRRGDVNIMGKGETPFYRDYVSVEALIHPLHQSKFKRERVVFNDGSTGIYRQLVQYLAAKGIVQVAESLPETGEANGTRYDVSFSWADEHDGSVTHSRVFRTRLVCPEGLRKSDYRNAYGEAQTWYLA